MTISPAFGRDYKSRKAAEADFRAGKDFNLHDVFSVQSEISNLVSGCPSGIPSSLKFSR